MPVEISVQVNGFKELLVALDNFGKVAPKAYKQKIRSALIKARESARTYPPHTGGRYKRTRTYYRSFKVEQVSDGWALTVNAFDPRGRDYGAFVGGDEGGLGQSWNTGHWPIIRHEVNKEVGPLTTEIELTLQQVAAIYGLGGP